MDNMHAPNAIEELRKDVHAAKMALEQHVDVFIRNTNSALDALAEYHQSSKRSADTPSKKLKIH